MTPAGGKPDERLSGPSRKNAYRTDLKVIHVGTPGVFHYPRPGMNVTRCGRDMADARLTAHPLADYQPCAVCFENWDCTFDPDSEVAA